MKKIINLTQHLATPEQVNEGVVDYKPTKVWQPSREDLLKLLTFEELPTRYHIYTRAEKIADCVDTEEYELAMIGGALWLMPILAEKLELRGIQPIYSFSQRVSEEVYLPDGSVKKVQNFKHIGFVYV